MRTEVDNDGNLLKDKEIGESEAMVKGKSHPDVMVKGIQSQPVINVDMLFK